jgi:hypothetical protein
MVSGNGGIRTMRPIKVIGITGARSGSSYYFANLKNFMLQQRDDVSYLAECFHSGFREGNFELNNGILTVNSKDPALRENFWNTVRVNRVTMDYIEQCTNPIVAKVFPSQMNAIPHDRFWHFLNHSGQNIRRVFLYRQDLEDRILSKFYAQETGIYKSWEGYDYTGVEFDYNHDHWWMIREYVEDQRQLFNIYDCCEWDSVIKYEDLTGDPVVDLQPMFDCPLQPLANNFQKLITKQEKMDRMRNYPEFKAVFDRICNELNVDPRGDPI